MLVFVISIAKIKRKIHPCSFFHHFFCFCIRQPPLFTTNNGKGLFSCRKPAQKPAENPFFMPITRKRNHFIGRNGTIIPNFLLSLWMKAGAELPPSLRKPHAFLIYKIGNYETNDEKNHTRTRAPPGHHVHHRRPDHQKRQQLHPGNSREQRHRQGLP